MKALSVRQPFAMFIANRKKTLEIKPHKTNYRGELLICSSKKIHDGNCMVENNGNFGLANCEFYYSMLTIHHTQPSAETGKAIAIVNLVDCRKMEDTEADKLAARHDFVEGAYVWVFENAERITPFSVRGKLGMFEVDYKPQNLES
jgi:hypothetical protein